MFSSTSSCGTLRLLLGAWSWTWPWSMFNSISSCGTLRFAPWQWMPLWPWSMFNSISSCGTLRFAPWQWMPLWPWSMFSSIFFSFWPCGPSFPCILALWAFISLHFGLAGLHFLSFWPFRGQRLGPPPQVAKNGSFAQRPYNGFISAVTGSILQFLAFWAFISLYFGLVGLHFLAFLPFGPSFPFILSFSGSASGPPPQVAKNGPFAQRPYNGFISAVTGSILQFLAFWAFISLHFGLVGLHLLAFWPCGPSFPCILALWAFISLHFGLVGLHFLSFWPFRGRLLGPPRKLPKMARLPNVLTMDLSAPWPAPFCSF